MLHSPIQQMFTKHLWSARHWWTRQVKVCLRDPHSHRDIWHPNDNFALLSETGFLHALYLEPSAYSFQWSVKSHLRGRAQPKLRSLYQSLESDIFSQTICNRMLFSQQNFKCPETGTQSSWYLHYLAEELVFSRYWINV